MKSQKSAAKPGTMPATKARALVRGFPREFVEAHIYNDQRLVAISSWYLNSPKRPAHPFLYKIAAGELGPRQGRVTVSQRHAVLNIMRERLRAGSRRRGRP